MKYDKAELADSLIYGERPKFGKHVDNKDADSQPTEAIKITSEHTVLKPWILPTANAFIKDSLKHHTRPKGNPGEKFPFVQSTFNDSVWDTVNLPHDWAINEPFQTGWDAQVGGGMGRLPSHGVAWYRKKVHIPAEDDGKSIYLYVEGALSYAMVWLNGKLVGGWPYGYNSWKLNLTPYINYGKKNQLAIRIDNPPASARWYPGGGIYRDMWLIKTNAVHVGQWGTFITTKDISDERATIDLALTLENNSNRDETIKILTEIYELNSLGNAKGNIVSFFPESMVKISANGSEKIYTSTTIEKPALWGPPPTQKPNLYEAVTRVFRDGKEIDTYKTRFGIRDLKFDANKGIVVNGEHIKIKGVNQHHDLGALGAAFNKRAAERQLEILQDMGCNAIRMAHNPPAPELLELTDRMGFMVVDEIFDVWERKKTPLDFHLIFPDWYEADTRAFIRRDRNCPSIIMWSYGNEVGEQYTKEKGAKVAKQLHDIVKEEDASRPTTASMNFAKPYMPFSEVPDVISLNYQGEGIRDAEAYSHLKGIRTSPLYPAFRDKYPQKLIVSSETASALSTRGTYLFPVFEGISAPAEDGKGGDPNTQYVSAYELYTAPFGSSADKVFASQDKHPYVAGEFVWSGWDYLGEPTPYYLSRSSYCGIIDLAGFKKDRFYLYQARWRPNLPLIHIMPHWNWPDRIGKITPVHVLTSGDEAELFLNGKSLGRKKKGKFEYRLRWDNVIYEPGDLKVIAYKNNKLWAEKVTQTTSEPYRVEAEIDRDNINADGKDLSFITAKIVDKNGLIVPTACNLIEFEIKGPAEIVGTDNGDPTDMNSFSSHKRKAFNGLALCIVKTKEGLQGEIKVTLKSKELETCSINALTYD